MQHTIFHKKLKFNKLIILDCVPDGDMQTARRLHENLSDRGFRTGIALLKIKDTITLREVLQQIKESFQPELNIGMQPIIHIEAHGNPQSMELPDGSYFSWDELANNLRIINQFMCNQLITFIGTCHGYNFIYINHTITKFTPVYFCIAPLDSIPAGDLQDSTFAFYQSLFTTGDLTLSASLLDDSKFYTYNSDYMFHRAFHEAMQRGHRGKNLRERKEALISKAINELGDVWNGMSESDRSAFLKKARKLLDDKLKRKDSLKSEFDRFSICYMGYSNDEVFEEIWNHMQSDKQAK
ncbi:TPA: hypothetical protein OT780_003175 [Klebsiella variicola]|nr:hypothetical protein [Klebsiella variicola]